MKIVIFRKMKLFFTFKRVFNEEHRREVLTIFRFRSLGIIDLEVGKQNIVEFLSKYFGSSITFGEPEVNPNGNNCLWNPLSWNGERLGFGLNSEVVNDFYCYAPYDAAPSTMIFLIEEIIRMRKMSKLYVDCNWY